MKQHKHSSTTNRRQALFGGGIGIGILLRGLATGLPPAWLSAPRFALAQQMNEALPQILIMSTSSAGDPVNINCPGSYVNGVTNNPILEVSNNIRLGGRPGVRGARVWGALPNGLRNRLAFIHYSSRTAAHPEFTKAMTLHGAVKTSQGNGTEMLSSALASLGAEPLACRQREPIPLSNQPVTFEGQPLQHVKPSELKALFAAQEDNLADLRSVRDQALNELYQGLQNGGTRAQKKFLDRYLLSRDQARSLGEELGALLEGLSIDPDLQDGPGDQIKAAVALAQLSIAPVINIKIPFGGDNHQDSDLSIEAEETTSGVGHIRELWSLLGTANHRERVSFAMLNVFGRTFNRNSQGGRNHNRYHGVMVAFGSKIKGGVYGGVNSDGRAMNIDPVTGEAREQGGISAELALEAAGTSLARSMGYSEEQVSSRIQGGELIQSFLSS